jgi:thiamine-monophosphate kinase
MTTIIENALIERLAAGLPRSPQQLNKLRESDAELIRLPGTNIVLALTTDGVVEEIEVGLYDDPYLIGWMTVMVNASDLAAVGAEPLGILLNQTLAPDLDDDFVARLQAGVRDACTACSLNVLGGDTNFSDRLQMSATAIGTVTVGRPLTRRGCRPGHRLFASGPLGLGSAYALLKLGGDPGAAGATVEYKPTARLSEGRLLRRFATCCMDTSDGVIPTLDELMGLNGVGFTLEQPVEELLHPSAVAVSNATGMPAWMMLAGPHGEFELLFTVPAERCDAFVEAAAAIGWAPLEIGTVTSGVGLRISIDTEAAPVTLDTARARNLFLEVDGDVEAYVAGLLRIDATLRRPSYADGPAPAGS